MKLISTGYEVTPTMLARIRNCAKMRAGVAEPVQVLLQGSKRLLPAAPARRSM